MAFVSSLINTYKALDLQAILLGSRSYKALYVNSSKNQLGYDAWGRSKSIQDYSILHGIWTFDVADEIWKTAHNTIEYPNNINNVHIYSEDGALIVSSGDITNDFCAISSKRHPRYQPNRGHLYSTSVIIPNITTGIKEFGLFTSENGVFFRQKEDGKLYAVLRTLGVETHEELITLPSNIDLTKGNIFDIQFQWRGVGSYFFYINLEKVKTIELLGTLTSLSISNPALPIRYRAINTNGVALMKVGCVDVTSEGGIAEGQSYRSISTGEDLLLASNDNIFGDAILAIRIPTNYKGKYNTIDNELLRITSFCKDESNLVIFTTRNVNIVGNIANNINPLNGWADFAGGSIQYMKGGRNSILESNFSSNKDDTVAQVAISRTGIDFPNTISNPNNKSSFFLTNGDYLIVCVRSDGDNKGVACNIELGTEI